MTQNKRQLITYPHIDSPINMIQTILDRCEYNNVELPLLEFRGFVKLHGQNYAIVCMDNDLYVQSRRTVIDLNDKEDHFCEFLRAHPQIINYAKELHKKASKPNACTVLYGEFAGKGVQKAVAVTKLEKFFYQFAIRHLSEQDLKDMQEAQETTKHIGQWIEGVELKRYTSEEQSKYELEKSRLYLAADFESYGIGIDMKDFNSSQTIIDILTLRVEQSCPVGNKLGAAGIGEGIVWQCVSDIKNLRTLGIRFKTKGLKHKVSNKKQKNPLAPEIHDSISKAAQSYTTTVRLEQGIEVLKEKSLALDNKSMGEFISWVVKDVLREERVEIEKNKFDKKTLCFECAKIAKNYYLTSTENNLKLKVLKMKP